MPKALDCQLASPRYREAMPTSEEKTSAGSLNLKDGLSFEYATAIDIRHTKIVAHNYLSLEKNTRIGDIRARHSRHFLAECFDGSK